MTVPRATQYAARRKCNGFERHGRPAIKPLRGLLLSGTTEITYSLPTRHPCRLKEHDMSVTEQHAQKLPVSPRRIVAAICVLVAASAAVWIATPHLPIRYTCSFRDFSTLRWLWPGNGPIYADLDQWNGAVNQECSLFSITSTWSVIFAIFSILFYVCLLSKSDPKTVKAHPVIATLVMAYMIIGMLTGGFNDHATGRGAWGAYHTTDSTNALVWKALVREMVIYFFFPIWISNLRASWRQ